MSKGTSRRRRRRGRVRQSQATHTSHTQTRRQTGRTPLLTLGTLLASAALHAATPAPLSAAVPLPLKPPPFREFGYVVPASRPFTFAAYADDVAAPVAAGLQQEQEYAFDIPPGPLSDALIAFSRITGVQTVFAVEGLESLQSPGVRGRHSADRALALLLEGTGAAARFGSGSNATIDVAGQSESVDVVGRTEQVTSPKYVVPVRDIPQTVVVIPRSIIETQAATTLSEALRNVPGITMQAGEGGGASNTSGDMFNMRGFNAANSVFVDGVRDDGLISRDTFNLEQVEVFMGPTGTDVGRGTAAGYVNMSSKAPRLASNQSAMLMLGTSNQKRVTLDFNERIPVGDTDSWLGQSAARVNILWQDSETPGRDFAARESRAIAPSLALGLQSRTRVIASAQFMRQENLPDYGVPGAAWIEEPLTPTTQVASAPVDQTNFFGSPAYDYDDAAQNSVLARVEHDLNSSLTVRNQTRYNETKREAVVTAIQNVAAYDANTNLVTLSRQGNIRENSIVSNLTNAVGRFSTGSLRHAATAGVEFIAEQQLAPTLAGLGTRAPVDIFNPDTGSPVVGFVPVPGTAYTNGSVDTQAVYASDAVDLSRRWQVSGAVRVEHYAADFDSLTAAGVPSVANSSDTLVSGKAGALYRLSATGNLYASIGTTKTPPGTANFTLSAQPGNQNNPNVQPQESANLEFGGKWDGANGRLSTSAAIFRTVNRNVLFVVDATAIPPIFNQDDEQMVRGVSLGMSGRLTDAWEIFANAAYLDSESLSQNSVNNGKRLPLTPEFSGSIWTTYRLPRNLTVGGGIRHTGPVYVNQANTIRVPGYQLIDMVAEYPLNTHLSLRVNASNLGGVTYIRNVNNNGGRYNPGYSRAVLVTTSVQF